MAERKGEERVEGEEEEECDYEWGIEEAAGLSSPSD